MTGEQRGWWRRNRRDIRTTAEVGLFFIFPIFALGLAIVLGADWIIRSFAS